MLRVIQFVRNCTFPELNENRYALVIPTVKNNPGRALLFNVNPSAVLIGRRCLSEQVVSSIRPRGPHKQRKDAYYMLSFISACLNH